MTIKTPDADLDDVVAWGRRLVETRDVDPVYDMLWGARSSGEMSEHQLKRWLVAYWCLYHAGAASSISELDGGAFWRLMATAAANNAQTRWPRATERRHWRGRAAANAVGVLRSMFPIPELMVDFVVDGFAESGGPYAAADVRANVERFPSFGPWISFKAADMLERVLGYQVEFTLADSMYESPRGVAEELALVWHGGEGGVGLVARRLSAEFQDLSPPGRPSRFVDLQEIETILCKWGSARKGHYRIGKDLLEVRASLEGWGATAATLAKHLPPPLSDSA